MVASDIVVEWDFDNDGDFDEPEETVTSFVVGLGTTTGRDWPSQLTGKAGPGKLRMTLRNDDDRFSYFNTSSPVNAGDFSLKTGRKIRVRTSTAADPDPALLVRDRFDRGDGTLGNAETGQAWTNVNAARFVVQDGQAVATTSDTTRINLAVVDAGQTSYYAQVTVTEIGEMCNDVTGTAGRQEYDVVGLIYRYQDSNDYSYLRLARLVPNEFIRLELVNVVAGVETGVTGASGLLNPGINQLVPRDNVVLGVHVVGSTVTAYFNGCPVMSGTAIQTDETEVGIYGEWGAGNLAPKFDDFHVWETVTAPTEGVLWTGNITDIVARSAPGGDKTVSLSAEGPMARMAATKIRPESIHGNLANEGVGVNRGNYTGQVVGEALAKAGMLYPPGHLDRGTIAAGAYGYEDIGALDFARIAEELELGFLYESPEGWVNFDDRAARDSSHSAVTFSDAPGAALSYSEIQPYDWRREIITSVTAQVASSAPQVRVAGSDTEASTAAGVGNPVIANMPSDIQNGDLLVVIIASTVGNETDPWQVPIFWVKNHDNGSSGSRRMAIYSRIDDGSSAGASYTFFNDDADTGGAYVARTYVIHNWYRDHQGIQLGDFVKVVGGEDGSTPAPILPSWGLESPSLFIAARMGSGFLGAGAITSPTYPLGYLVGLSKFQNGAVDAFDVGLQSAIRTDVAAIESPGPFTGFVNLFNAESVVVAVRGLNGVPPVTQGRVRVQRDDLDSQHEHNVVRTHVGPTQFRYEGDANEYTRAVLERHSDDRPILKIGFYASKSTEHRAQAIERRLSDRVTVVADNNAGLGIDGDFHIESINHTWSHGTRLWKTEWEVSPANPVWRADTAGSTLDHDRNAVVVNMNIATTTGPLWIDSATYPAHFPFDIEIDSEQLRVTSITGTTSPQAFVVERGVNGTTAASHTSGAAVSLADPLIAT